MHHSLFRNSVQFTGQLMSQVNLSSHYRSGQVIIGYLFSKVTEKGPEGHGFRQR